MPRALSKFRECFELCHQFHQTSFICLSFNQNPSRVAFSLSFANLFDKSTSSRPHSFCIVTYQTYLVIPSSCSPLYLQYTMHSANFLRFLRVPCGAWGLLRLPVCCVGAVFPENACQSSCSGALDARRFFILGRLEKGLQGNYPLNRDFAWWGELMRH